MKKTTIAIPFELKEQIQEFGLRGETYTDIILRLIKSAKERQLHDLLIDEEGTISIEDAIKGAEKKWSK